MDDRIKGQQAIVKAACIDTRHEHAAGVLSEICSEERMRLEKRSWIGDLEDAVVRERVDPGIEAYNRHEAVNRSIVRQVIGGDATRILDRDCIGRKRADDRRARLYGDVE